jgi:hypothetical protein
MFETLATEREKMWVASSVLRTISALTRRHIQRGIKQMILKINLCSDAFIEQKLFINQQRFHKQSSKLSFSVV